MTSQIRDTREASSSRQHIKTVNLSNILQICLLKTRNEVAISFSISIGNKVSCFCPKKIEKERIYMPVTAFSAVTKDMPFTHAELHSFEKSL